MMCGGHDERAGTQELAADRDGSRLPEQSVLRLRKRRRRWQRREKIGRRSRGRSGRRVCNTATEWCALATFSRVDDQPGRTRRRRRGARRGAQRTAFGEREQRPLLFGLAALRISSVPSLQPACSQSLSQSMNSRPTRRRIALQSARSSRRGRLGQELDAGGHDGETRGGLLDFTQQVRMLRIALGARRTTASPFRWGQWLEAARLQSQPATARLKIHRGRRENCRSGRCTRTQRRPLPLLRRLASSYE